MLFYKYVKNYVTIMEVNNFFPLSYYSCIIQNSFYTYCGVMGPKSYNGVWGFGRERGSLSPRRNISSDQLKLGHISPK